MTVADFIRDMEGYYGDSYGDSGRRILGQYLGKLDDGLLPYLYAEALKTVERRYKTAPGVAELEKVKREARAEMRSARALIAAQGEPLQIGEDVLDPQAVAQILARLAAGKKLDSPE